MVVMPVGQRYQHLETLVANGVPMVLVDRSFEHLKTSTVVIIAPSALPRAAIDAIESSVGSNCWMLVPDARLSTALTKPAAFGWRPARTSSTDVSTAE